jgi:mitochondrial fission protein ELM1
VLACSKPPIKAPPVVWVLADDRPGNTTQSTGLARALGWPYEVKELHFTTRVRLLYRLLGAYAATRVGLDKVRSAPLIPPWPDVVIAAGWRPASVARWVRKQSHGQTRVVQMGRKGGHVAPLFDAVVTCEHCCLPPHPRRVETVAPLTRITIDQLAQASERWQHLFEHVPRPHVALLVGGSTGRYRLDTETAERMGEEIRTFAQDTGGSVFATTSRRTGVEVGNVTNE